MGPAVQPVLKRLGLADLEGCWAAIRPVPERVPDVMVTCQGGLLLGVVDQYSFDSVDQELREKLFGAVEVQPAEAVELNDRVGFAYRPKESLAMGIVPYDQAWLAPGWLARAT